jgi:hypothetical protein
LKPSNAKAAEIRPAMAYSPIKMALFRNSELPREKPESKSCEQVESYVYAYGDYAIRE